MNAKVEVERIVSEGITRKEYAETLSSLTEDEIAQIDAVLTLETQKMKFAYYQKGNKAIADNTPDFPEFQHEFGGHNLLELTAIRRKEETGADFVDTLKALSEKMYPYFYPAVVEEAIKIAKAELNTGELDKRDIGSRLRRLVEYLGCMVKYDPLRDSAASFIEPPLRKAHKELRTLFD